MAGIRDPTLPPPHPRYPKTVPREFPSCTEPNDESNDESNDEPRDEPNAPNQNTPDEKTLGNGLGMWVLECGGHCLPEPFSSYAMTSPILYPELAIAIATLNKS